MSSWLLMKERWYANLLLPLQKENDAEIEEYLRTVMDEEEDVSWMNSHWLLLWSPNNVVSLLMWGEHCQDQHIWIGSHDPFKIRS